MTGTSPLFVSNEQIGTEDDLEEEYDLESLPKTKNANPSVPLQDIKPVEMRVCVSGLLCHTEGLGVMRKVVGAMSQLKLKRPEAAEQEEDLDKDKRPGERTRKNPEVDMMSVLGALIGNNEVIVRLMGDEEVREVVGEDWGE